MHNFWIFQEAGVGSRSRPIQKLRSRSRAVWAPTPQPWTQEGHNTCKYIHSTAQLTNTTTKLQIQPTHTDTNNFNPNTAHGTHTKKKTTVAHTWQSN